jgi:hypothetical protein
MMQIGYLVYSAGLWTLIVIIGYFYFRLRNSFDVAVDVNEHLIDKIDGLSADLDAAIEVMRRRVSGEADIASMGEWLDLNYPQKENDHA